MTKDILDPFGARATLETSAGPVGIYLTILSLCGLFASYCRNKVFKDNFLTQIVLTFLMALVFNLLNFFTGIMIKNAELLTVDIQNTFASTVLAASLYTAIFAPPAFFFFKRLLTVRTLQLQR